jgi:hypothetical protein
MPAHIKAYLFLLPLCLVGFAFLKWAFRPEIATEREVQFHRRVWLLMTSAAFLAGNFWVYAVLCLMVARYAVRRQPNPLSIYVLLRSLPCLVCYLAREHLKASFRSSMNGY